MTSYDETPGSYVKHGQDSYGASPSCIKRMLGLAKSEGAKVIITSNWRKFDEEGPLSIWSNAYGDVHNPLPKFKKQIKDVYLTDLPKIRHLPKSQVLKLWFDSQDPRELNNFKFVIFDDDRREGFQDLEDYCIKDHFILTNTMRGLTDEDCERARELLK